MNSKGKQKIKDTSKMKWKRDPTKMKYLFQKGSNHSGWKGGISGRNSYYEKIAGRKRPEQCEICGAFDTKICYDHNHQYEKTDPRGFRGWLCQRCNAALGMVKDKVEVLKLLINYLEKF